MIVLVSLIFAFPILSGGLFVHLFWRDRGLGPLLFKGFLGIGIGLGVSSVLYFVYLIWFAGQRWFIFVQLAALSALLAAVILVERKRGVGLRRHTRLPRLPAALWFFAIVGCAVFLISLVSTGAYLLRRRQGDWDAWMMYNRAARFVYRDQTHWLQSFSPQMDPIFHADYPLLLAMNTASGWAALDRDTPRVPMLQSALFAVACLGLAVSALATVKSAGQAALGLMLLWGTPVFVNEGAREMADVPLAFYILATIVLTYLFVQHERPGLLVLAGLSAGLAAWTKNEGSSFVIAAAVGLGIAFARQSHGRVLLWYAAGLAVPLAVVLYFKFALAPPSDVLSSGAARSMQQILDLSRHAEIARYFLGEFIGFGNWDVAALPLGIFVVLIIYYMLFRVPISPQNRPAYVAAFTMLVVQAAGYYAIYLITPYDLPWHLSYSTTRVVLQVFPMLTFLILTASATPESVFGSALAVSNGENHAARD